jgi:hypothetical protein
MDNADKKSDTKNKSVGIKGKMNISGNARFRFINDTIEKAVFSLLKKRRYDLF